jgi:MinD-like ATPase involved in chromosome partitioning or flagellar assembly
MNKIVTIHSFRRGVGKTTLAANLAVLLTLQGKRVALVDRNFQTPSIHLFFDLYDDEIQHTFNDYLWNKCDILSTAQDITFKLGPGVNGKLFLIAASTQSAEILHTLRNPLDFDRYTHGLQELLEKLALDYILVDTPAGINEDTLPSIAVSNTLLVVLHPDKRDFQGTAVIVDIARQLQVPKIDLVLNDTPEALDMASAQSELEHTYRCGKGTILPHTKELMALVSSKPFVLCYPQYPLTTKLKELTELL